MGAGADYAFYEDGEPRESGSRDQPRIRLIAFDDIAINTEPAYLVKGLIPRAGLIVVWGPPKSGKSFWSFDLLMHVALGWKYRERRVLAGPVVYVAAEGATGLRARVEAFRQKRMASEPGPVPFYLVPVNLDLAAERAELIAAIRLTLGDIKPAVVCLDTLNRTLRGSESSDEDMGAYIVAADAVREAFDDCAIVVVHHCGVDGSRPRGHTSLTGACDAQIAIKRDVGGTITATVEWMKDGPEGDVLASRLVPVDVGTDSDGDPITSCIIEAADVTAIDEAGARLTANQNTMLAILVDAGQGGLDVDTWNERAREAGLGQRRRTDLYDMRRALKRKKCVYEYADRWFVCP